MLNQFSGEFFGFVMLFSQYLDIEPLFHLKLNMLKTLMVSFGSKSPEIETETETETKTKTKTEASLSNLIVYFDDSGAWSIPFYSPFSNCDIAV
jgi:hypothetical protein